MKRALILDFDGPLFSERTVKYHPKNQDAGLVRSWVIRNFGTEEIGHKIINYCFMDETAVGMLNKLYLDNPYEIVVSSTWAEVCTKNQIESLFVLNGIAAPMHKDWDCPKNGRFSATRLHRIKWWLEAHQNYDYAIIDDPWSFSEIMNENLLIRHGYDVDRVVCVDPNIGILLEDMEKIYRAWI